MKSLPILVALALSLTAASTRAQHGDPDEFLRLEPVLRRAMTKIAPSVVTVETFGGSRKLLTASDKNDGLAQPKRPPKPKPKDDEKKDEKKDGEKKKPVLRPGGFLQTQGRTTGVVFSADGWILVSRFALNFDPTTILITLADGRTFHAERKGEDTSRGLALVKIEAKDLPVPAFLDPADVKVGQWAFALGRTFAAAAEPTVHMGIVSATRRQFGRALQIDAYTSPANYGGPVIDVEGRVLGVSVPLSPTGRDAGAEWYDSGIGFAATVGDIESLLDRMQQGEVLHRGWLGVQLSTEFMGPGAKLAQVPRGGVAHKAGLRKGDIIVRVDGIEVLNSFHLQMLVSSRMGGDPVGMKVKKKREDEPVGMTLFLADTPYEEQKESKETDLPASFPLPDKK